jgi:two-component system LytT family response regulator
MISTIIIDDEPLARGIVKEFLSFHEDIRVVAECANGFDAVKAIATHKPDLLFMDIQMPKINGFETLELLDEKPAVIFTTAFDEYALQAFDAHAVDYLLKPFSRERFEQALAKWRMQSATGNVDAMLSSATQPNEAQRFVVKKGQDIRIIPAHEVQYLEAYDDYVKVHCAGGYYLKKKTMQHYENVLDASQFIRVHRSYMVQLSEITRIEPAGKDGHVALLKSGVKVPLSKPGFAKLKLALGI